MDTLETKLNEIDANSNSHDTLDSTVQLTAESKTKKIRKKRKQEDIKLSSNDHDVLIGHNSVGKTESFPSTSNDMLLINQQKIEMFLKNNTCEQTMEFNKTGDANQNIHEDVRRVALNLAMENKQRNTNEEISQPIMHIDYVLTYSNKLENSENKNSVLLNNLRKKFETRVKKEGLTLVNKTRGNLTFVIITCSFIKLCQEAEAVSLKIPLAGFEASIGGPVPRFWKYFQTDDEVDLVSALFCYNKKEIYEGINDPDTFFRPSLRSLLVHHILINLNIDESQSTTTSWDFHRNSQGLAYMLMHGVYKDAFCVHSPSRMDPIFSDEEESVGNSSFLSTISMEKQSDPRKVLNNTWLKWKKFQPLWKIRNYFGEKIALYFAWLGLLVTSLWVPMLIGFGVALWGFTNATLELLEHKKAGRIEESKSANDTLSIGDTVQGWMRESFDNTATPFFALIICLWGTIFLELWKRKTAELAYQWDVSDFEEQEPNRPQFYGTKIQKDPITGKDVWVYPLKKQYKKFAGSFSVLLLMVCLVIAATFGIIIYRVVSRVDIFDKKGSIGPTLASVTSSFLNTICIMVMGKCYERLAVVLTDWENYRTQTSYEDALIVKLFAFQFINSYSSLYYIAFFRGNTNENGVLDKGVEYSDGCGENNDCMTMLSLQVAMLMIMKPFPKLLTDFILPWFQHMWHRGIKRTCCWCFRNHQIHSSMDVSLEEFVESELQKPEIGDFTLSEYNEKVIQYGFLMLFAAAFPLAPLIALLTNMFDLRMDAKRLLWTNRRPVAFRAEDIGMWYSILQFLNIVGVVTNGFLVAFTSQYGRNWEGHSVVTVTQQLFNSTVNATVLQQTIIQKNSGRNRLWLVIGFEHIVFAVKFFIAFVIPDVPSHVKRAERREKYHVDQLLEKAGIRRGPGKKPSEFSLPLRKDSEMQTEPDDEYHERTTDKEVENQTITIRPRRHKKKKHKINEQASESHVDYRDVVNEPELSIAFPKLDPLPSGYLPTLPSLDVSTNDNSVV